MSRFSDVVGDTYKVIKGYVSPRKAKALAKDFIEYTANNQIQTAFEFEGLVRNANDRYNYPTHLNILSRKTADISKILGADVNPAYTYTRVYGTGGVLEKHKDRKSCEVSLSIHLNGDKPWAFCIENLEGEEVEVILEPGDAILYDAPNANHWRNGEYEGEAYCQTFHHYVYVDGEFTDYAFDTPNIQTKKNRILTENLLQDYVHVWDDILSPDTVRLAMEVADLDSEHWIRAETSGGSTDYRKCYTHEISPQNSDLEKELDAQLFTATGEVFRRLNISHKYLSIDTDDGYRLLRYPGGDFKGKYDEHTDHSRTENRMFTIIFILNDDYEGGELTLFNHQLVLKPQAGTIVAFPSSFMFPHAVLPCTSGERRSIITWAT